MKLLQPQQQQQQQHHHPRKKQQNKQQQQLPSLTILLLGLICLYGILSFCKLSLSIEKNNINLTTTTTTTNNNNLLLLQLQQQQQQQSRRRQTYEEDIGSGDDSAIIIKKNHDEDGQQQQNENLKEQAKPKLHHKQDGTDDIISKGTESSSSSSSICHNHHVVYDQIKVANVTTTTSSTTTTKTEIRILCFIMTHSNNHQTKVKAVLDTWGKRCDKLLIASNVTDTTLGTIKLSEDSSYLGLWSKLNETMNYVYDHYYDYYNSHYSQTQTSNSYDWILKADDDSYVIMENLIYMLLSDTIQKKISSSKNKNISLIFGRRYSSPRYRNLANQKEYFASSINSEFGKRYYNKINKHKPVLYNYGGSGYVMNWNYISKFVEVMKGPDTIHGTPPEDQANGVVMAYHNIWPQPTRDTNIWPHLQQQQQQSTTTTTATNNTGHGDTSNNNSNATMTKQKKSVLLGREMFHPENPDFMYSMDEKYQKRWNDNHKSTGGISVGEECCSIYSIVFHHLNPTKMREMEQIFYDCRREKNE